MFTTLHDLIHGLPEDEILRACAETDPEFADQYADMLRELKAVQPIRQTMTIVLRMVPQMNFKRVNGKLVRAEDKIVLDISGEELGDDTSYAIEFSPWAEWLGMTFRVEGCDLTPAQIAAECLNEMTWGGWTEHDQTETREMIGERMQEVHDLVDEDNNPDTPEKKT